MATHPCAHWAVLIRLGGLSLTKINYKRHEAGREMRCRAWGREELEGGSVDGYDQYILFELSVNKKFY